MKKYSNKDYAKHCFDYECTLPFLYLCWQISVIHSVALKKASTVHTRVVGRSVQVFQKFSRDRWKIKIFLERKSRNRLFFQFFYNKSLLFCFKSEWRFSWGFFWGILRFCKSKIGDFRIFASDFFHFDLGHFRYLLRPNYEPQRPQWGLKF